MTVEHGPIWGVELLDSLPLDGGMRQALPSRKDLDDVRQTNINGNDRLVAGYEVLLEHYYRAVKRAEIAEARCEQLVKGQESLQQIVLCKAKELTALAAIREIVKWGLPDCIRFTNFDDHGVKAVQEWLMEAGKIEHGRELRLEAEAQAADAAGGVMKSYKLCATNYPHPDIITGQHTNGAATVWVQIDGEGPWYNTHSHSQHRVRREMEMNGPDRIIAGTWNEYEAAGGE